MNFDFLESEYVDQPRKKIKIDLYLKEDKDKLKL